MERFVLLCGDCDDMVQHSLELFEEFETQGHRSGTLPEGPSLDLSEAFEISERQLLIKALEQAKYRKNNAARILGISRTTLWRKLHRYGFENVA